MCFMIGIGNLWGFPIKALEHGGGTFVIIYIIMVCLVGFPLVFMELALAQYKSLGPSQLFAQISPYFKGLGYGMVLVSALTSIWYNAICSWFILYMFSSFQSKLPWADCGESSSGHCNKSANIIGSIEDEYWSPSQYYYFVDFLGHNPGAMEVDLYKIGSIRWQLALSLLAAWLIVCLCVVRGIQSMGNVVVVMVLSPQIILLILLIIGLTLDGASDGISHFIIPKWDKFLELEV